jgi:hypothetical protein
MTYTVEIEFDKVDYDKGSANHYLILEWLIENFGSSIGEDRVWNSNFDYKRSAPWKLLMVYSFKNSQDATLFALKWS